jgi:steroid delta-isomerase-like uncharacterized protein
MAEAFNARDFDRARELVSDDVEFVDVAMGQTMHGPDAFIEYFRMWASAFSDMTIEPLALVADESRAAGEFRGRGTHDGPLQTPAGEIPPTGRTLDERFTWFGEVADGKVTGVRDYYNAMSVMMQLGLMPEAAEAS